MIREVFLIKRYNYTLFGQSEKSYWWTTDYGTWSNKIDKSSQFNTYAEALSILIELLRNNDAKYIQIDKVFTWQAEN